MQAVQLDVEGQLIDSVAAKVQLVVELLAKDPRDGLALEFFLEELEHEFDEANVPLVTPNIALPSRPHYCPQSDAARQAVDRSQADQEDLAECLTFTQWLLERQERLAVDCGAQDELYESWLFQNQDRIGEAEAEIEGLLGDLYSLLHDAGESNSKFASRIRSEFYIKQRKG